VAVILLVGGGALAVATWISGQHGLAIGVVAFYVVAAAVAVLWSRGSGDVAAILRGGGDERQRGLDRDATAAAGLVMALTAIIGAIVETARTGSPGAYGLMAAAGGISYAVALVVVRLRR
jgi:hypothetical protein